MRGTHVTQMLTVMTMLVMEKATGEATIVYNAQTQIHYVYSDYGDRNNNN